MMELANTDIEWIHFGKTSDHIARFAPVDHFFVDDLGRFWLRLTRRSPAREWLILNNEGVPKRIVQHPKEVRVTHVSSQNIGIREEDRATFSLYELVD